ncbi:MAG: dipeptidase [Treponema sp.]|nr:dipeptidase [Treponema sp.]
MAYKVIDLHCDSVFALMDGKDLRKPVEGVHVDLPRLRKGNVALQVFAVYVPSTLEGDVFHYTMERLDAIDTFSQSHDLLTPVETAAELRHVIAMEKTGIMAAVENGIAIENSLEKLEKLRRRKVRIMTLVHFQHLPWIESSTGNEPFCPNGERSRGLSRFGEQVVDAMCDFGIIPDLSHASENAFWDVIRRTKKPVIASHSCAFNLCASARNLKDDQLKALGDSGSLVGVNFYSGFLSESFRQKYEKMLDSLDSASIVDSAPQSIIADHIDYMVKIAGEDCVALGSDFDGIPAAPQGVTGSDFYPFLEAELRSRGYTEKRIAKIFNENFLRVLEAWD